MKFSDIDRKEWFKLKPYLDTCLLPVTGLDGSEEPWEALQELEFLRNLLDFIEVPYKGRTVTYPALHYVDYEKPAVEMIDRVCERLKKTGFRYVIVMTGQTGAIEGELQHADLVLTTEDDTGRAMNSEVFKKYVDDHVRSLWKQPSSATENQ